ncbi:DUF4920 domain-containing protein [Mariniflexile litorale]|uniref:DUF4920 domain-containing protein n=1 Tax=Mariniflexile litorale TaxID=3045158 RepID=A0AAU7EBV8_9FLAO|nr:DUF4920 domain-containing protein [Mariniflexile sp. KMM 9835]MDQ8212652.1 DUF4920 domain-containing protein [Mariniflexile sp. KMM 9835]
MKHLLFVTFCLLVVYSCKDRDIYKSYGKKITVEEVKETFNIITHYKTMQVGDTVYAKMKAKVKDVCQAKGCWMTLDLEEGNEVMVKFKDYGFFVPKDITDKEVIINGKAFVSEVSVNKQRHYAEDAGKTADEIAEIIQPKRTFSFEADGVLIQQ